MVPGLPGSHRNSASQLPPALACRASCFCEPDRGVSKSHDVPVLGAYLLGVRRNKHAQRGVQSVEGGAGLPLHWERRGLSQPGISAHTQPLAWFPRVALLCSLPPPSPSCSTDAEERGLQLGEAGSGWLEGKHCAARVVLED